MSSRRKRSPEEQARREKIRELLQSSGVSSMEDIQNLFKETIAEFMENGLDAELDTELGYSRYDYKNKDTDNSRNGHSSKTLRTSFGDVEVSVPRDRKGEFDPQILKKNQTSISQDVEEKILSMYAKGMTTSDIEAHIRDIYGIEVSDTTVSRVTDKILPIAKEWQQRPLEAIYAVVFLDAIHYHVRSEGQIIKKAVYIAIGINLDGKKDVLGMWVGENESAKFWATVLNGLKNRGVEDIFIACTDNLTGFSSAIEAVFPKTEIQNCIIHQLRNSSKYVSYKDIKALMADLKAVYAAVDEAAALDALDTFSERWDKKYPKISQSWRDNWPNLSTYFKFPQEVRRLIYTTNTIEGFNRQLRKVTKSKSVFPTDDSLLRNLRVGKRIDVGRKNPEAGQLNIYGEEMPERINGDKKYLWGKNYIPNSEIKFEYCLGGVHSSYPDFIFMDCFDRIHIFEVKGLNMSKNQNVGFETDVYEEKIEELKRSYLQASILTGYYFYLPMLIGEEWIITQIINGTEKTISLDQLRRFLKHKKTEFNK